LERPYIAKTVIPELPFFSETSYGFTHANPNGKPAKIINPRSNKSPLAPGLPLLGES